jgi:hypothetical protein
MVAVLRVQSLLVVDPNYTEVRKRIFCAIFILNRIILPRQARDKHRESTQKESGAFLQATVEIHAKGPGVELHVARNETLSGARDKTTDHLLVSPFVPRIYHCFLHVIPSLSWQTAVFHPSVSGTKSGVCFLQALPVPPRRRPSTTQSR